MNPAMFYVLRIKNPPKIRVTPFLPIPCHSHSSKCIFPCCKPNSRSCSVSHGRSITCVLKPSQLMQVIRALNFPISTTHRRWKDGLTKVPLCKLGLLVTWWNCMRQMYAIDVKEGSERALESNEGSPLSVSMLPKNVVRGNDPSDPITVKEEPQCLVCSTYKESIYVSEQLRTSGNRGVWV